MDQPTGPEAYRACRDILVPHRDDYDAAVAAFRWPDIGDRFNWALDWFDPIAAGNPRTALRIAGEEGSDRSYSFAELAARSDRLVTSLAAGGVAPGDRVIVMLGSQVELWESMLRVIEVGGGHHAGHERTGGQRHCRPCRQGGRTPCHHQCRPGRQIR
jgi:acetyl-CoA synthetase